MNNKTTTGTGWLDGFRNPDGSVMTPEEFGVTWANRTPIPDLIAGLEDALRQDGGEK